MNLRSLFVVPFLCLLLMILGLRAGSAQEVEPLVPEWLQQMYAEGWEKVQEGVLRRDMGEGKFETFSYGAEGLQSVIDGYAEDLAFLEERYSEAPSEDLARLIERVQGEIDKLAETLVSAPSAEAFDGSAMVECTEAAYDPEASAGAMESPQGVTATATAYYHTSCAGYTGDTFAYAFAEVTDPVTGLRSIDIKEHPLNQGTWLDSSATASKQGSMGCHSKAQASVTLNDGSVLLAEDEHDGCQLPVQATVSGPTAVTTDHYTNPCADVTWTASATQGTPGYTYEWYIGTALQGTGATLTKSYCNTTESVTVRVVATDTEEWSDEATFTTNIQHVEPLVATVSGPSLVTSNNNDDEECVTVRWTASASGAHPGYTYSWYLGTGTTVQGTGSTLTKQFCETSPSAAKVVVRDSDGHTAEAITTPVTASITGPATVNTDYYFNACANVTWTASASQGTPGYTYQWYIGNNSQGTGTTLTKSYCNISRSATVKVVATDSQGWSDEETFTTNVQYTGPLTASVSGPSSVETSTCTNVTWTASASGAHPAYTYSWYIGTSTTVQGTGSTLTKQYCSGTSVTVKVVVQDSDGHTANATKTTTIDPPPPLTASISGPASIALQTAGECRSLSWTASAAGGAPGYTYTWYLGTSTTAAGTGSTLTKTFCGAQTINVKVVARDSAGATVNATKTTTITYTPLTASISGGTEVWIYSAGECVNISWTASATGGAPGYTYTWYLGTSTTAAGTGSTFTKNFCGQQTINVKVIARDTAAQTDDATFTTVIRRDYSTTCGGPGQPVCN